MDEPQWGHSRRFGVPHRLIGENLGGIVSVVNAHVNGGGNLGASLLVSVNTRTVS